MFSQKKLLAPDCSDWKTISFWFFLHCSHWNTWEALWQSRYSIVLSSKESDQLCATFDLPCIRSTRMIQAAHGMNKETPIDLQNIRVWILCVVIIFVGTRIFGSRKGLVLWRPLCHHGTKGAAAAVCGHLGLWTAGIEPDLCRRSQSASSAWSGGCCGWCGACCAACCPSIGNWSVHRQLQQDWCDRDLRPHRLCVDCIPGVGFQAAFCWWCHRLRLPWQNHRWPYWGQACLLPPQSWERLEGWCRPFKLTERQCCYVQSKETACTWLFRLEDNFFLIFPALFSLKHMRGIVTIALQHCAIVLQSWPVVCYFWSSMHKKHKNDTSSTWHE